MIISALKCEGIRIYGQWPLLIIMLGFLVLATSLTALGYSQMPGVDFELLPIQIAQTMTATIWPYIPLFYAAISLAHERQTGTLTRIISSPLRRSDIVFAKWCFSIIFLFTTVAVVFLIGIAIPCFLSGEIALNNQIPILTLALCILLLPTVSIGMLASVLVPGPGTAAFSAFSCFAILDIAKQFTGLDGFFFTSYLQLPFEMYYDHIHDFPVKAYPIDSILITLLWTIIPLLTSILIFSKSRIQ